MFYGLSATYSSKLFAVLDQTFRIFESSRKGGTLKRIANMWATVILTVWHGFWPTWADTKNGFMEIPIMDYDHYLKQHKTRPMAFCFVFKYTNDSNPTSPTNKHGTLKQNLASGKLTYTLPDRGWKTSFHYKLVIFRVQLFTCQRVNHGPRQIPMLRLKAQTSPMIRCVVKCSERKTAMTHENWP